MNHLLLDQTLPFSDWNVMHSNFGIHCKDKKKSCRRHSVSHLDIISLSKAITGL